MLQPGNRLPRFAVTTIDGSRVDDSAVWQRRNLVLVCLPARHVNRFQDYAAALASRVQEVAAHDPDNACIVTADQVPGVPCPGVLVADRWGEVYFVARAGEVEGLPAPDQVLEWLRTVQHECPECQGEAR